MAIEQWADDAVRDALLRNAGVTEMAGQRIYPLMIPQGAPLPCITYQRYSSSPHTDLLGYTDESVVMLVVVYSCKYGEAKALAKAVRAALSGAPLNAEFRYDQDLYTAEPGQTGAYSVHMEFICYQSGGYCYA